MTKGLEAIRIADENDFDFDVSKLNESERRALKWLVKKHNIKPRTIERKNTGADFVVVTDGDKIAIEVKLREPYRFTESQMEDVNEYEEFYVVVAKKGDIRVADKIESIEFGDTGDFYINYYPWADDALELYDMIENEKPSGYIPFSLPRRDDVICDSIVPMILDCVYGYKHITIKRDDDFKETFNSLVESCHKYDPEEFQEFVEEIGSIRPKRDIEWWPQYFSDEMGIERP